jgi:hypothetical protein
METILIAEDFLNQYTEGQDPIVKASNEAAVCHACEEWLQSGIDACRWIFTASEAIRQAYVRDLKIDGVEFASAKIRELYKAWLKPCDSVEGLILKVEGLGYSVTNKAHYFDCKQRINDKLTTYEMRDFSLAAYEDGFFDVCQD